MSPLDPEHNRRVDGVFCIEWIVMAVFTPFPESSREVCREGDSAGICSGYDSVQSPEAAGEPGAAEVRRRGHHGGHQVPAGESGRERAGSEVLLLGTAHHPPVQVYRIGVLMISKYVLNLSLVSSDI